MSFRCEISHENSERCKELSIETIEVTLLQDETMRKYIREWRLCNYHLDKFLLDDGNGWYKWNQGKYKMRVISYDLLEIIH